MNEEQKIEILLAEYQAAHASFHHYDGFRWQSGSLLIAGALVIWGSLLSNVGICTSTINLTSVLIALIFTAWILYAHHYRQMYMTKLFRIHEIEKILNMELNKNHGFLGVPEGGYSKFGPKGHIIDMFVYILVSLFGPFLASIQKNSHFPLVFSVLVIAITIGIVNNNEKRMIESYKEKLKTS
jgi:hypothetical protein